MINNVKVDRKIKKTKTSRLLLTDGLDNIIMNCNKYHSTFSGMIFIIGRLRRVRQFVNRNKICKAFFNNTFCEFRKERQMRNGSTIRQVILSQLGCLRRGINEEDLNWSEIQKQEKDC
jgi:hypothetical protein